MKFAVFTSNVHKQRLPYKAYGKVDFHLGKSEFKVCKKKNPPKIAAHIAYFLKKLTNTYTWTDE